MSLKSVLKHLVPLSFLKWQKAARQKIYTGRAYQYLIVRRKAAKMRKKGVIHVLFIAYTPAMWKTDSLYRAMKNNPRFEVELLLVPHMATKDLGLRVNVLEALRSFFKKRGYEYIEWCDIEGNTQYQKLPSKYDIILYPQPWRGNVPYPFDFEQNAQRLIINCEYAFHSINQKWQYNKWLQNAAWLDLHENEVTYRLSCKEKDNRGINSIVTGLPIVDEFLHKEYHSPWKSQPLPCKKIIWAPHWTITEHSSILPSYSNFLEMADFMLSFSRENKENIQFAFKPHPRLKPSLYNHPEWGKEKTDAYYKAWEDGENTQLEEGEYVDLFMTSDALVHDSCSFCCEYMLTGKPVLFMAKNEELQVSVLNEMARSAFHAQYLGYSLADLQHFIESRVMASSDPKKEERVEVVTRYLLPPNGRTAAENIIQAILGA